jgi:hypothetical protein
VSFWVAIGVTRNWKLPLSLVALFVVFQVLQTQTAIGDVNPFRLSISSIVMHILAFGLPAAILVWLTLKALAKRKAR